MALDKFICGRIQLKSNTTHRDHKIIIYNANPGPAAAVWCVQACERISLCRWQGTDICERLALQKYMSGIISILRIRTEKDVFPAVLFIGFWLSFFPLLSFEGGEVV